MILSDREISNLIMDIETTRNKLKESSLSEFITVQQALNKILSNHERTLDMLDDIIKDEDSDR